MLLENLVTRCVSEENVSNSSLTRRVTKQGYLLLGALADTAYKAGETSFVQVLVARRTYFDTNLQYIASRSLLAQSRAKVDGYVLTDALNAVEDRSGDDSLRGLTFSQQ